MAKYQKKFTKEHQVQFKIEKSIYDIKEEKSKKETKKNKAEKSKREIKLYNNITRLVKNQRKARKEYKVPL